MQSAASMFIAIAVILATEFANCGELQLDQKNAIEEVKKEGATVTIGPAPDFFLTIDYPRAKSDADPFFDILPRLVNLRSLVIRGDQQSNVRNLDGACLRRLDTCPQIESLRFDCKSLANQDLHALERLPNLKSLTIQVSADGPFSGYSYLTEITTLKTLESLTLRGPGHSTPQDGDCAWLVSFPAIREIEMWGKDITEAGIAQLATKKDLRKLSLRGIKLTDAGMQSIGGLHDLETLAVFGPKITDDGMKSFEGLTKLKRLELSSCEKVTPAGFAELQNLHELQELIIGSCNLGSGGTTNLAELHHLKRLYLSKCNLGDDDLSGLRELKKIEHLTIRGESLTDAAMNSLGKLTSLKILELQCKMSDTGLSSLNGLSKLTEVSIVNKSMTSAGLAFLQQCSDLQSLELLHSPIGGSGLKPLAGCKALKSLSLIECQLTDSDLADLDGHDNLEWLDLRKNDKFTNAGIAHLGKLTGLRVLLLSQSSATEESLSHLETLKNLEYFRFETPKFTNRGFDSLSRLKSLRSINLFGELLCDAKCIESLRKLKNLKRLRVAVSKIGPLTVFDIPKAFPELEFDSGRKIWNQNRTALIPDWRPVPVD